MINIAILQSDSSHAETYIAVANAPGSPFADRARVVTLWGKDGDEARAKATLGVRATASIAEAVSAADVVMVCGRFGDTHYPVVREALAGGRPLYVDKPLTNSADEARDLAQRLAAAGTPAFSASPLRFAPEIVQLAADARKAGGFRGGSVTGLSEWADFGARGRAIHFYGVHSAEILHAVFGPGIAAVRVEAAPPGEIALVRYRDGRVVAWHLLRDAGEIYAATYHGAERTVSASVAADSPFYPATLDAVVTMAQTRLPPIPFDHAVEIVCLLDAVERARSGPGWVTL